MPYLVTLVEGIRCNNRRVIAFLESPIRRDINGKAYFEKLKANKKQNVLSRFDHWVDGNVFDKYFHGYPNDERYKECFVFKWTQAGTNHRLYGFICHPDQERPARQACILVVHAQKTDESDYAALALVNQLRQDPEVIRAVDLAFPK